jgi:hypothetical protein
LINICYQCGLYRADKEIDPSGPYAICPECGYKHPFLRLPLLVVAGASCAGKTSVLRQLQGRLTAAVFLDSDILWRAEFNRPDIGYSDFFETWLRMCKNISQSGRPVVLFGAGLGVPENLEPCIERRYFSAIHYLALVCSDDVLIERLQQRPAWRGTRDPDFIEAQVQFNHWFKEYSGQPAVRLVDTTGAIAEATAGSVLEWIETILK